MDWDDLHPYLGRGNPRYDEAWYRALVLQIGLLEAIHEQSDPGSLIKATAANAVDAMCVKLRRYRSKIERRRVNMSDLKGSSSIRQDAHEVLVVERGMVTKARQFSHTMVYIDKCRSEFGGNGAEVLLAFDPIALVYTATPEESPTRQGGGQICSTSSVSVRPPPRRQKKEPAT